MARLKQVHEAVLHDITMEYMEDSPQQYLSTVDREIFIYRSLVPVVTKIKHANFLTMSDELRYTCYMQLL